MPWICHALYVSIFNQQSIVELTILTFIIQVSLSQYIGCRIDRPDKAVADRNLIKILKLLYHLFR